MHLQCMIYKSCIFSAWFIVLKQYCFYWMNKYKARHVSSHYPLIMRIFCILLRWSLLQQFVPLQFFVTWFIFSWKREGAGKVGLTLLSTWKQLLWTNADSSFSAELWHDGLCSELVILGPRQWDAGQEGIIIRKAWPRMLSLHIWVTRAWMLPCYLIFTTWFCDDQHP